MNVKPKNHNFLSIKVFLARPGQWSNISTNDVDYRTYPTDVYVNSI